MLVELHRLLPGLVGISKEIPLNILLPRRAEDRLRADPLVDVQGNGINLEPSLLLGLALSGPLQPGLMITQSFSQELVLFGGDGLTAGLLQQGGDLVCLAGGIEAQHGGKVGVVVVTLLLGLRHRALAGNHCCGDIRSLVISVLVMNYLLVVYAFFLSLRHRCKPLSVRL